MILFQKTLNSLETYLRHGRVNDITCFTLVASTDNELTIVEKVHIELDLKASVNNTEIEEFIKDEKLTEDSFVKLLARVSEVLNSHRTRTKKLPSEWWIEISTRRNLAKEILKGTKTISFTLEVYYFYFNEDIGKGY